jgi:hypothetical protein
MARLNRTGAKLMHKYHLHATSIPTGILTVLTEDGSTF